MCDESIFGSDFNFVWFLSLSSVSVIGFTEGYKSGAGEAGLKFLEDFGVGRSAAARDCFSYRLLLPCMYCVCMWLQLVLRFLFYFIVLIGLDL